MKSANETQNKGVIYVSVGYESLQNIANSQTVCIPADTMKHLSEERITFLQLPPEAPLASVNNNIGIYSHKEINHVDKLDHSTIIDLPADGDVNHRTPQLQCTICKEKFTKAALYRKHIEFHSNMKKYKCSHCFESYNVEDNYKLHMAMHTSGSPVCPLCNKKFQRFAGFKSHLLLHQVEETFTCKECLAEFDKETDYVKHIEKHTITDETEKEKLPYVCSYCNYVFDDVAKYKDHITHHIKIKKLVFNNKRTRQRPSDNKDNPHKCTTCGKSFRKTCLLERHLRIHSGERPYACTKCDKKFTQKGSLQIHLLKHTGHKPHKCTLCPASFFQKCNLRVHVEKAHTVPQDVTKVYKCVQCTCVFKKIATLNTHVTKVHTGVKQTVDEYQEVANQLRQLQELTGQINIRKNDDLTNVQISVNYVKLSETAIDGTIRSYTVKQRVIGTIKTYMCTYCSKEFKKPSDLIRHLRVHTREKPYVCRICQTAFSLKSVLRAHMNTHLGKKEHQCLMCLKQFSSTKRLNKHLKTHGNCDDAVTLKYKCSSCDKLFNTLQSIKHHMELHKCLTSNDVVISEKSSFDMKQPILKTQLGLIELSTPKFLAPYINDGQKKERPFKCHLCPGAFMKSDHLRAHMNSHSTQKAHKCEVCGQTFSTVSNLNYHKLKHGPKKYECAICFKKFSKRACQQAHQLRHTNIGSYVCPYCKEEFKSASECRAHIRTHKAEVNLNLNDQLEMIIQKSTDPLGSNYDILNMKNESTMSNSLEPNNKVTNKRTDILEKLNPMKSLTQELSSNIINQDMTEEVDKGMTYSVTYADGSSLQDVEIGPIIAEDNQNYSTIFITCNDSHQIGTDIFESDLTQQKMQIPNAVIQEPQDVNLLFMEPLTQQVDFQETQNFVSFNQTMLNETVIPSEINLDAEDVNLQLTTPVSDENVATQNILSNLDDIDNPPGIKINLVEPPEMEQDKFILKQVPKLIVPIENTNGLKENVYITISVDDLKANNLNYLSNMIGLNNIISENSPVVENINLVATNDATVSESRTEEAGLQRNAIMCAVCKVSCNTLEDLGSHHCIDVLSKKENEILQSTLIEENQETIVEEGNVIETDDKVQEIMDETQIEQQHRNNTIQESREGGESSVAQVDKKKSLKMCQFCFKEFGKLSDLQRHIRTHTGERPYKCEKCIKSFSLKSTLRSHMRTHDPTDSKITCHICNYTYSCKASLKVHMMIHSGAKPYQCPLCPASFRTTTHRKIHIEKHDQLNKPKKKGTVKSDIKNVLNYTNNYFESMLSGERDANTEQMQLTDSANTISIDGNGKVISSNTIDASETLTMNDSINIDFLQQLQLGQHLVFDIDEIQDKNVSQPLIIEHLANQPEINIHMPSVISPVKEKKFKCDICNRMYSTKSILKKHQRNHKKFLCLKCKKQFDVEDELEKHIKIHMGYRPFSCLHCANSFSEEASLKTHMKRIHNLLL